MCNGHSQRESEGGVVAILKPVLGQLTQLPELAFRMSETPAPSQTLASVNDDISGGEILIHHDGDLRSTTVSDASILHRIKFPSVLEAGARFAVPARLELSVGGEGVIGRRVSLLVAGKVWGQGIMGWN